MKAIKFLGLLLIAKLYFGCNDGTQEPQRQFFFQPFTLNEVQLLPGVFKESQSTAIDYMLALDPDRLLAPFLAEAGLEPKSENYPNWERTGLNGHIAGHYLTALSQMYAATGDQQLIHLLDYMIGELKRCQEAIGTGYIGGTPAGEAMWREIAAGQITSENFKLNQHWVPLYNLHKLLAGLRDAYLIGQKTIAREMLIELTDYIEKISVKLSDQQIQTMLVAEHGGINEVFADVYAITSDKKYLTLAKRFSHRMVLEPLVRLQDSLTGLHANTQIPKVVGFQRIAELSGDEDFARAARFFWETVVHNRTVVIGGNSVQEHFNPIDDFGDMITNIAGPETCNTYNMLKLSRQLFKADGHMRHLNYYERALYNHILSSQHPVRGGFVYYTPMRPRHYRVYSQPSQGMWCCVGTGMENHGKYTELIYSHRNGDLYVNLFIPSMLNWSAKGLTLSQHTNFPNEETTQITIEGVTTNTFDIYIRYPHWVAPEQLAISINGGAVHGNAQPNSYVRLSRRWKKGDIIEVSLPMQLSTEPLPANRNFIAFLHGPIVLAARTSTTNLDNLLGDSLQWEGYRARGKEYPIDTAPMLALDEPNLERFLKPVEGRPQTFVAPDLIIPSTYKNLELIPFYRVHDARYMIYWQIRSSE